MSPAAADGERHWRFYRIGLLVTGRGEEEFLPDFFRSLAATGWCSFRVVRRIRQLSPIRSEKRRLQMIGSGKQIPTRDVEEIGLTARGFLSSEDHFLLLIDDLEASRSDDIRQIFDRYRMALDEVLTEKQARRTSVHFLVNMLEAYYFADTRAVNEVLGTDLDDYEGDVEAIRHPKNQLKSICPGFDERRHGGQIVRCLNLLHVLSRADSCCSLRTVFSWIYRAIGEPDGEIRPLLDGCHNEVTKGQICSLPPGKAS